MLTFPKSPDEQLVLKIVLPVAVCIVVVLFFGYKEWRRRNENCTNAKKETPMEISNIGPRFNVFRSHKIFCHGADNRPPLPPQTPTLELVPIEGLTRRNSANSHVDDLGLRRVYSGNSARVDMTRVTYEASLQQPQISEDVYPEVQGPHQPFPVATMKIEAKSGH